MKALFSLVLAVSMCAAAIGQTVIVDAAGASSGKYWIEVTVVGGKVTATVVSSDNVVSLSGEDPGGGGPTDPSSPIGTVALEAKKLVTDDEKTGNSVKISAVYTQIAKEIGETFHHEGGDAPWQELANATRTIRNTLLGRDRQAWEPWVGAIGKALSAMEDASRLEDDASMRQAYEDIAAGVVADLSREDISPETWAMIMKIITMLLEMWLGGGFGGFGG